MSKNEISNKHLIIIGWHSRDIVCVQAVLNDASKQLQRQYSIGRFLRMEVGEGIQRYVYIVPVQRNKKLNSSENTGWGSLLFLHNICYLDVQGREEFCSRSSGTSCLVISSVESCDQLWAHNTLACGDALDIERQEFPLLPYVSSPA